MKKLGMITIGQAPRHDVAPIVEKYLDQRAELVQAGALDGMSKAQIEAELAPGPEDYVLTSKLVSGESVNLSREKIKPLIQQKIEQMEADGITTILLLCTGVFPGLQARSSVLIEPDHIIPPSVKALLGDRKLGVVSPLPEQMDNLKQKFIPYDIEPAAAAANPYQPGTEQFAQAAKELKELDADVLILDCMGYTEEMRDIAAEASGLPVILSNALMAKLVAEII
ncbi:AroM family protein [Terribacillus saccharophilus]|uniref:AroM family protein n=1 Tax=Terribacillus saccharophilus TaxID=361277 RepID=UPI003981C734